MSYALILSNVGVSSSFEFFVLITFFYSFFEFSPQLIQGSINLLDNRSPPRTRSFITFSPDNSLTLSAYLRVFKVSSQHEDEGETFAIITVLQFPIKESLRTSVSFDPRNGVCFLS